MARADSTVRVNIIGDAKSLTKAADSAESSVKGISKTALKLGGALAVGFATDQLLDFGATALNEADRVSDAAGRIESQLGTLSQSVIDTADDFTKLGASEGDMLDLEAAIIDVGTALGIADEKLAPLSVNAAATAAGLALITDTDADTWMATHGKAAGGSEKALRALGVSVTDSEVEMRALADTGKDSADQLTAGELAAARLALILEELQPRLAEVTTGTGDLEQKQAELQARMETLTGKIGEHLEGPLNDLAGWVLSGIDGWEMLGGKLEDARIDFGLLEGPIKLLALPFTVLAHTIGFAADNLDHLINLLAQIGPGTLHGKLLDRLSPGFTGQIGGAPGGGGGVNVHVQGGSPEAIEQAVRRAINTANRHG